MRPTITISLLVALIGCADADNGTGPQYTGSAGSTSKPVETADDIESECLGYAFLFCNDFPDCACQAHENCAGVKRPPASESYKTDACHSVAIGPKTNLKCAANGGTPWPVQCQQGYPK